MFAICNYRICSTDAVIENRTLDRAAPLGGATVWFVSHVLGPAMASEIYLEGKSLTASVARDLELVNAIAPSNDLRAFAEEKARVFAARDKYALRTLTIALDNAHLALPDYLYEIGTGFESALTEV